MKNIKKMVLSALFVSIGLILPFFTGQIQKIGNMLLPMHIPVILCGFICGWKYALAVGFILPLMRSFIFSMPPMYPNAVSMAFELAAYGFFVSIVYSKFKKKDLKAIYISLIASMLAGRLIWGVAQVFLLGIKNSMFTYNAFVAGAFLNAIPGIILQLVLIPVIMVVVNKKK